jgi:hypothetical protein
VAIVLWIKALPKCVYQYESDFLLTQTFGSPLNFTGLKKRSLTEKVLQETEERLQEGKPVSPISLILNAVAHRDFHQ